MRKVQDRAISFAGYDDPQNLAELELEILGLEHAKSIAESRVALLKQTYALHKSAMATKAANPQEAQQGEAPSDDGQGKEKE